MSRRSGRVRMRHPDLPDREILAHPSPIRAAAGWTPVDELERAVAAPDTAASVGPSAAEHETPRRRRTKPEGTEG